MAIISLRNALLKTPEEIGIVARDLARIQNIGINVPITAILDSSVFTSLLDSYALRLKIDEILRDTPDKQEASARILMLFQELELPQELLEEANEALSLLGESILESKESIALMIPSAMSLNEELFNTGSQIVMNKEELKEKLLDLYASCASLPVIEKDGWIKHMAVIVQELKDFNASGVILLEGVDKYRIIAVPGIMDIYDKYLFERGEKYVYSNNDLRLLEEHEALYGLFLTEKGLTKREVKGRIINDKQVEEIVSTIKRIRREEPGIYKAYWAIKDEKVYILLVYRGEPVVKEIKPVEEPSIPEEEGVGEEWEKELEEDLEFIEEMEKLEKETEEQGEIEEERVKEIEQEITHKVEEPTIEKEEQEKKEEVEPGIQEEDIFSLVEKEEEALEQGEEVIEEKISPDMSSGDLYHSIKTSFNSLIINAFLAVKKKLLEEYPWIKEFTREELSSIESADMIEKILELKQLYERALEAEPMTRQELFKALIILESFFNE